MIAVDTNVVVRYIVATDDLRQSEKARDLVEASAIFVPVTVMLETEWVLRGVYGICRKTVCEALRAFADLPNVDVAHRHQVERALDWCSAGLDFADALHLAGAQSAGTFATFDKALIRAGAIVGTPTIRPV